ncbi:MAG: YCF48-related protein [Amphritea sp.]
MKITINLIVASLWLLFSSWALAAQPAQITPLAYQSLMTDIASAEGQVIAVGEQGHILFSRGNGRSWSQGKVPVDNLLTAITMLNKNTAWAVGHDGVVIKTEDGGANWKLIYSLLENSGADFVDPLLDVIFWDNQNGMAVGAFGQYYRTSDGGASWLNLSKRLPNEDELHLNAILRTPDQELWIASEYGTVFRSSDNGQNWETITFPADGSFFTLAYKPDTRDVIVAGIAGNAFSFDLNDAEISSLALPINQSIYDAQLVNSRLHLVGANGIWQQGQSFKIDDNRISRHAITPSGDGLFSIATAQGIQVVNGEGQNIALQHTAAEEK